MANCPCCGQDVPDPQLVIDKASGRVGRFGWEVKLTPPEMHLLLALLRGAPNVVTYGQIITAIYAGSVEPDDAEGSIKVFAHRLRRKLQRMGIEIRNTRGDGYSLHSDPETLRAVKRIASRRAA